MNTKNIKQHQKILKMIQEINSHLHETQDHTLINNTKYLQHKTGNKPELTGAHQLSQVPVRDYRYHERGYQFSLLTRAFFFTFCVLT